MTTKPLLAYKVNTLYNISSLKNLLRQLIDYLKCKKRKQTKKKHNTCMSEKHIYRVLFIKIAIQRNIRKLIGCSFEFFSLRSVFDLFCYFFLSDFVLCSFSSISIFHFPALVYYLVYVSHLFFVLVTYIRF